MTILDHGLRELHLEDYLKIYYGTGYDSKTSYLQLKGGKTIIDTLGNIYASDGITISGYWSKLRVAGLLPDNYCPSFTN